MWDNKSFRTSFIIIEKSDSLLNVYIAKLIYQYNGCMQYESQGQDGLPYPTLLVFIYGNYSCPKLLEPPGQPKVLLWLWIRSGLKWKENLNLNFSFEFQYYHFFTANLSSLPGFFHPLFSEKLKSSFAKKNLTFQCSVVIWLILKIGRSLLAFEPARSVL